MSECTPAEVTFKDLSTITLQMSHSSAQRQGYDSKMSTFLAMTKPDLSTPQLQGWRAERAPRSSQSRGLAVRYGGQWGAPPAAHRAAKRTGRSRSGELNVFLPAPETTIKSVVPHQSQTSTEWKISPYAPFMVCISSKVLHRCRM